MSFSRNKESAPEAARKDAIRARWQAELERDRFEALAGEWSAPLQGPGAAPAVAAVARGAVTRVAAGTAAKQAAQKSVQSSITDSLSDPEAQKKEGVFQVMNLTTKAVDSFSAGLGIVVTFFIEAIYIGLSIISNGRTPVYSIGELMTRFDRLGFLLWFIFKAFIAMAIVLGMLALISLILAAGQCATAAGIFTCASNLVFGR